MTLSSALGSPTVRPASKDTVNSLWTAGLVMPCCRPTQRHFGRNQRFQKKLLEFA